MKTDVRKIYELLHSAILTPYNLLENVKLPNYSYVKYYTERDSVVCEMESIENNEKHIYYYYFDCNNHLYFAKAVLENLEEIIIFNREDEVQKRIIKYENNYMNKKKAN